MTKCSLVVLVPACPDWNVLASARFLRASLLLPHHGLADAIPPDQISAAVDAVRMLRSDGSTKGALEPAASFDRSDLSPREFSFSNKGFPATWTFFQDTPIVRSRSCCATSAGALLRISSF